MALFSNNPAAEGEHWLLIVGATDNSLSESSANNLDQ
jgi:hypothetical protein